MPNPDQTTPPSPHGKLHLKRPDHQDSSWVPPTGIPLEKEISWKGQRNIMRKALWIVALAWLVWLAFLMLDPLPVLFPKNSSAANWWRLSDEHVATHNAAYADALVDHPQLAALKTDVANAILNQNLVDVMRSIHKQQQNPQLYPYQDALAELATLLDGLQHVNTSVANILRQHIDREIEIRIKNRPLRIIPRASAGERVNALVVPARSNQRPRSATFNITDLSPSERARWIGEADTPEKCLMKLYLYMEAGDRVSARVFAPGCGILADALIAKLGISAP